jgi:predicted RNA-binding protein
VCEITSAVSYDKSSTWKDGLYPYRIRIKPLFSSQYPKEIDQTLIENLDFIPRKDNRWGCVLQRSMLEISEKDFFIILNYLNNP